MRTTAHAAYRAYRPRRPEKFRRFVVVIADPPLRAQVAEAFVHEGYDVALPVTPLDAIHFLLANRDEIDSIIISADARWAYGLSDLAADELPELPSVLVA
jgi:hypothetical protein